MCARQWTNAICNHGRELSFRRRQTPALRTWIGQHGEDRNRLALRHSPDSERCCRQPVPGNSRTGETVTHALFFLFLVLQTFSPEALQHMQAGAEAEKGGHLDVA